MREPVRPVRDIPSVRREDGTGLGVAAAQAVDGIAHGGPREPINREHIHRDDRPSGRRRSGCGRLTRVGGSHGRRRPDDEPVARQHPPRRWHPGLPRPSAGGLLRLPRVAGPRAPRRRHLDDRAAEITTLAGQYAAGRRPLPVFELIATVVHAKPGPDGLYRTRIDQEVVRRHLDAARRHGAILLLNIQPGRAAFLDEVKFWEPWLREPDVGLALDPEWAVKAGQVPGKVFGRMTGAELDTIAAYVAGIVAANRLPEKVVLYHQLHTSIVREPAGLQPHPGVALVVSVDGIGTPGQKTATWRSIVAVTPEHVHKGFKLFYDEDTATGPLMTPTQVLGLTPQPEYVLYE
ncbi:MAG: hypothetical protein IPJ15_00110 [Actinomycetales bacterium]|nr:hypothetical protein [Candidatus Phosphoribacter baldrii]